MKEKLARRLPLSSFNLHPSAFMSHYTYDAFSPRAYDPQGRLADFTLDSRYWAEYHYDDLGRLAIGSRSAINNQSGRLIGKLAKGRHVNRFVARAEA